MQGLKFGGPVGLFANYPCHREKDLEPETGLVAHGLYQGDVMEIVAAKHDHKLLPERTQAL